MLLVLDVDSELVIRSKIVTDEENRRNVARICGKISKDPRLIFLLSKN